MAAHRREFALAPIGFVRAQAERGSLRIEPPFRSALLGIEGFSHLQVLWWCDRLDSPAYRRQLTCERPYRKAPATLGVFATRSPIRHNPIGLTTVQPLAVDFERGIIEVAYIDAEDGTPILDIKPYHPSVDRVRDVTLPAWCSEWPRWYEDSAGFDWGSVFANARTP